MFRDAMGVGAGIVGFTVGPVSWLVIHFGGTYVAFAGYGDEQGSVLGGLLWLFLWGPLLSGLAMLPVGIVALITGAAMAPFVMMVANGFRMVSRVRIS